MMHRTLSVLALAAALFAVHSRVHAQTYPAKPVTMIIPFATEDGVYPD